MSILLLEWTESFGRPAPPWVERLVEGDATAELLRFLSGATMGLSSVGREADELLVEALAGLPPDGALVERIDHAGVDLLRHAEDGASGGEDLLAREAVLRLLRVAANVPEALRSVVGEVHQRVADGSYVTLLSSPGHDLAGEALQVVAVSQTDERFVPLWWRLCELQGAKPEHGLLGLLGLRWSRLADGDAEQLLTDALTRLARAADSASGDVLMSEHRARTLFLGAVRTTIRARTDLDWGRIGAAIWPAVEPRARTWVARAFGIEDTTKTASPVTADTGRYEDPAGARQLAARLKGGIGAAVEDAHAFLDRQRTEARRRGDALPLVQSLCYFANAVTPRAPELAAEWASEAAGWQPHNHYTAVTWAEALVAAGQIPAAANVLLSRLHFLAEHSPVWLETGKALEEAGEMSAAREALFQVVERFPANPRAWSALGEHEVRAGRAAEAAAMFESGLEVDLQNSYLWPGYVRALALGGRGDEALEALHKAEEALGPHHPMVKRRRRELKLGEFETRPPGVASSETRSQLSADALGTLARLLRRAARAARAGDDPSAIEDQHRVVLTELKARDGFSVTGSREIAFSDGLDPSRPLTEPIRELLRVRRERSAATGTRFDEDRFESLTFDGERSGVSDQRMVPLREVSRLRAFSQLVDGQVLDDHGMKALSALRDLTHASALPGLTDSKTRPLTVGQRRSTWAVTALNVLRLRADEAIDPPTLRAVTQDRSEQLDALEEDATIALIT